MDKDKDNPLRIDQLRELVKPRAALSTTPRAVRQYLQTVASAQAPEVKVKVVRRDAIAGQVDTFQYDIVVDVVGARVDQRAQARPAELSLVRRAHARAALAEQRPSLDPFIPDHLALAPFPALTRDEPRSAEALAADPQRRIPTTVFSPDERKVYQDIAYPWGTIGRVQTARGVGSGVMVGPRHLLTVSHVVDWGGPTGVGALRFTPGYYNGSQPFGQAIATRIYSYVKEDGVGGIDAHEQQFDYVVAVLDTRLGDSCGWMGTRSYTDAWDGQAFWSHAGYPSGLTSSLRPTFQHQIVMDGDNAQGDAHEAIFHRGDVETGQSGGPIFAWFDKGPCAVAVQSWHNATTNGASGGSDLIALLQQAINENP